MGEDRSGQVRTGTIGGDAARIALIAVVYFGAHEISLSFPDSLKVLAAVWPSAGIGLAALLLSPRRLWSWIVPVLFVAGNSANLLSGRPPFTSIGFMTANVLESVACAWLISRWAGKDVRFVRVKDVSALLVSGTLVNACTALIGAGTAAIASDAPFWSSWLTWWIADGLGILLVTPLIVTWVNIDDFFSGARKGKVFESALFMAVLITGAWLMVHGRGVETHSPLTPTPYMFLGLSAWAALRLGQPIVTLGLFVLGAVAITGKAAGVGPLLWGTIDPTQRLLLTQVYLGFVTSVALLLGATYNETKSAEKSSQEEHARLRALGDNLPNGVVYQVVQEHDGTMSFQYVSAGFERLNGVSGEDVLKDSGVLYRLIVKEDRALKMAAGEASAKAMSPLHVQFRIRRPDGEIRWMQLSASPRRLEDGRILWDGIQTDVTEHKRLEDSLNERLLFLRTLIDTIPNPVFFKEADGKYLGCNRAFEAYYSITRDWLKGRTVHDLLPQEYADNHIKIDAGLIGTRGSITYEARFNHFDGTTRDLINSKAVFMKPDGSAGGIVGVIMDVTAQKRAEEALKLSESKYRSLSTMLRLMCDNVPDMIWAKDLEKRFIFVNKAMCRGLLNAVDTDEPVGKTDLFFADRERAQHPDNPEWHTFGEICVDSDVLTLEAGVPSRFDEYGNVQGRFLFLDVHKAPFIDEKGQVIGTVGSGRDVTERKRAEEELRESEEKFRNLFAVESDALFLIDRETGAILEVNEAACRLYGYTREELLQLKNTDISVEPEETIRTMRESDCRIPDRQTRKKDGTLIPVDISVGYFTLKDRQVALAAIRDITSRKKMEAELLKMRTLESIGTLAGGIAHDFNNLLTVVVGNIVLAMMDLSPHEEAYKVLAQAEQVALGGRELTQRLITFSQGGFFLKQVLTLNQLVRDVSAAALSDSAIQAEYLLSDNLFPVLADDVQIRQVVHAIILNAKEAMPERGTVRLSTVNATLPSESMTRLPAGDYIKITVEDRGTGIGEDDLPKIFDPYFTTKGMGEQRGVGLGLAMAYSIIQKHNGHIDVQSVVDKGTTVNVYLPAYKEEVKEGRDRKEATESFRSKVLFMDDEESLRDMAGKLLTRMGYEPVTTRDGAEAIALYEEALSSERPFDVVILDLSTKHGMGGKETFKRLFSMDSNVKVIISSGYADDPVASNYADYGFRAAITKPYRVDELREALRKVIPNPFERGSRE